MTLVQFPVHPAHATRRDPNLSRIDSLRATILTHLVEIKDQHKAIPGDVLEECATSLDVTPGHLRRMIREFAALGRIPETAANPHKIEVDEWRAQVAYFQAAGNAKKALGLLKAAGAVPLSMDVRTFQRRVAEWDPALRACAKGGYRAMVKYQFFNTEFVPYRAYAYGTDHTFLPIQVIPPRSTKPVFPWLTTLVDLYSRVVLAYRLTLHTPTTIDNLHVFTEGIEGWYTPEGVFVGGKPGFVRSDRGSDFISHALNSNLINLGDIQRQFTQAYSSWQNGVVERMNGTIDKDFAPDVPGYFPGGEDEYTRRVLKTPIDVKSLLTLDTLDRRIGQFLGDFNNTPHASLNGKTPLEAWEADETPLVEADRDTLRQAMPHRESRVLHHYGVEARGRIYSGASLALLRQQNVREVNLRWHDHDIDRVFVFTGDDRFERIATRAEAQTEGDRFGVLSVRRAQNRRAEALIRAADRARVLAERERLREEGVDESEWPALPDEIAEHGTTPEGGSAADQAATALTQSGWDAMDDAFEQHNTATTNDDDQQESA